MSEYDSRDSFVLFKNDKKTGNQPDYKGSLTWGDGTKKDIAVWIKTAKSGKKFMSGSISEKWKPEGQSAPAPVDNTADDDIPF